MNDKIEQLTGEVIGIIHSNLYVPIDQIALTDDVVDDLGADSLDTIELTMALESAFGIEISDLEADQNLRVEDIVNLIAGKKGYI